MKSNNGGRGNNGFPDEKSIEQVQEQFIIGSDELLIDPDDVWLLREICDCGHRDCICPSDE